MSKRSKDYLITNTIISIIKIDFYELFLFFRAVILVDFGNPYRTNNFISSYGLESAYTNFRAPCIYKRISGTRRPGVWIRTRRTLIPGSSRGARISARIRVSVNRIFLIFSYVLVYVGLNVALNRIVD